MSNEEFELAKLLLLI